MDKGFAVNYRLEVIYQIKGYHLIVALNEKIFLLKPYTNYFVLAEWNLKKEQLLIRFEKEQQSKVIKKLSFKINPRSKEKLQKLTK